MVERIYKKGNEYVTELKNGPLARQNQYFRETFQSVQYLNFSVS